MTPPFFIDRERVRPFVCSLSNIPNTRKRVSSDSQTLRSRLKKRGADEFFLNAFEVFRYLMNHTRVFDMASQID